MRPPRHDEGFTLIELMVVVLIIGIIVAIAIPVFYGARATALERSCYANQRTLEGAAQTFAAQNGVLPPAVATLVPEFLKDAPACKRIGSSCAPGYSFRLPLDGTVSDCTGGAGSAPEHLHY